MTHLIILNEIDVCKIIAHEFNVKPERVLFYLGDKTTGYGATETIEQIPRVEITLDNPERTWKETTNA